MESQRKEIRIEYHGRFNHCYLIGALVDVPDKPGWKRVVWSDLKDTDLEIAKSKAYDRYGRNIIISHN
jgi:hypothetical protein